MIGYWTAWLLHAGGVAALAFFFREFYRMPLPRTAMARRLKWVLTATLVVLGVSAAAHFALLWRMAGLLAVPGAANGAAATVATTGAAIDATLREDASRFIERVGANRPEAGQTGRNIRLLQQGLEVLRMNRSKLPAGVRAEMAAWEALPSAAAHVLSPAEETAYYNAALSVYTALAALAAS